VKGTTRIGRAGLLALALLAPLCASAEELIVSAAASLTNAFKEIGSSFEQTHPGVKVVFNFAASGPLLQQIAQGAPADVFAAADQESMDKAQQQNLIAASTRADFVANKLVLVTPADSPVAITSLADLTKPEVKRIAIGNPASVPAGRYAKGALEAAKLWEPLLPKFVYADSVRQALAYVARAEAAAGFVYATDAGIEKDKVRVAAEVPVATPIFYPIAQVASSRNPALAREFLAYVLSPAGQKQLAGFGFASPEPRYAGGR
jgi:molybdate transport system substrate-binding protein